MLSELAQRQDSIPKWALHRRLYQWVLAFAHHKHATLALFCISFSESSFFPIAPDILQIVLTLERRSLAWYYAFISTIASVLGGIVGYGIGASIWYFVSEFFLHFVINQATFNQVALFYQKWDFWAVFVAAFTPIPYKVFTLAAGVFHLSFPMFILASIIGRAARFFLVAALLWSFGSSVKQFIEKYFNWLTFLLVSLLSVGLILLKYI